MTKEKPRSDLFIFKLTFCLGRVAWTPEHVMVLSNL